MIPGPDQVAAAMQRIRQLLIDHGFDPDSEPQGHDHKAKRDYLLFGMHFDRVDPVSGARECLENPEQILISRDTLRTPRHVGLFEQARAARADFAAQISHLRCQAATGTDHLAGLAELARLTERQTAEPAVWLTPDGARQYAVEHGGASFIICPVCEARTPNTGPAGLLEAALRRHLESHTPEEWLRAITRLQTRIDRALDACGSCVNALMEPAPLKRRVSAARVRAALRGTGRS